MSCSWHVRGPSSISHPSSAQSLTLGMLWRCYNITLLCTFHLQKLAFFFVIWVVICVCPFLYTNSLIVIFARRAFAAICNVDLLSAFLALLAAFLAALPTLLAVQAAVPRAGDGIKGVWRRNFKLISFHSQYYGPSSPGGHLLNLHRVLCQNSTRVGWINYANTNHQTFVFPS